MRSPDSVKNPLAHVCLVRRPDGRKDLHRPGSFLFGSLAPIPDEAARYFRGVLPGRRPLNWPPSKKYVLGVFED